MPNHDELDPGFRVWRRALGQRIKAARLALEITQPQAAQRCGYESWKQYQDYEDGRRPLTLRTLYAILHGLGLAEDQVLRLAPAQEADPPTPGFLTPLLSAGWRRAPKGREHTAIPVYDLRAAAGPQGVERTPDAFAHLRPPAHRRFVTVEGLFLAQVHGPSMAPEIPDGAWCLFRQPAVPPLLGKVLLLRHTDTGSDDAGAFQLKRVGGLREADDGVHVTLVSRNPAFPPTDLRVPTEADVQAPGELLEVVG